MTDEPRCRYIHHEPCCEHRQRDHAVRVVDWFTDEPVGICESCDEDETLAIISHANDDATSEMRRRAQDMECIHDFEPISICDRPEHAPLVINGHASPTLLARAVAHWMAVQW